MRKEPVLATVNQEVSWYNYCKSFVAKFLWEIILFGILLLELVFLKIYLPTVLSPDVFLGITNNFMETALIALSMALVIITKNIDISVGSMLALVSVILALCVQAAAPLWLAILVTLVVGILAGCVNGVLITKMNIPALVVTLGTFSLYRGIAYVILGDQTYHNYSESFMNLGQGTIFGIVPVPLLIFLIFAVLFAVLLHTTVFGRYVYAIGNNKKAALYSGVKVNQITMIIFAMVGLMTAIASIVMTARNASTRGNMATGLELDVITAVVLGGVAMEGGKGNILGVILAVFIIGILRNGMYALNISPEIMKIAIGGMLILSLLVPKLIKLPKGVRM
jgi:rhamnose transport system permease protein